MNGTITQKMHVIKTINLNIVYYSLYFSKIVFFSLFFMKFPTCKQENDQFPCTNHILINFVADFLQKKKQKLPQNTINHCSCQKQIDRFISMNLISVGSDS